METAFNIIENPNTHLQFWSANIPSLPFSSNGMISVDIKVIKVNPYVIPVLIDNPYHYIVSTGIVSFISLVRH